MATQTAIETIIANGAVWGGSFKKALVIKGIGWIERYNQGPKAGHVYANLNGGYQAEVTGSLALAVNVRLG